MESFRILLKAKKRGAVCALALLIACGAVTGSTQIELNAAEVDNDSISDSFRSAAHTGKSLPSVRKLDDRRPVNMWKAGLSRYSKVSLTKYETVGIGMGREQNPFAYMPLGELRTPGGQGLDNIDCSEKYGAQSTVPASDDSQETSKTPEKGKVKFRFTTYGWGHGLGLSQNGANYYATYGGYDYKQILAHYYPGTYIQCSETAEDEIITVGDVSGTPMEVIPMVVYNEISDCMHPEAMKAQAIAAYSYIKRNGGSVPDLGVRSDPPQNVIDAVSEVLGQALYFDGSFALAMFSASSGGATASCSDIYLENIPYLTSVSSDYDEEYDPNYGTEVVFSQEEVRKALESNLKITLSDDPKNWIKLTEGDGGYIKTAEIDGQVTITGNELKVCLGLKSAKFDMTVSS